MHRNHRLWCQIQGGGKRRSGATSIDDNVVDDAIAGEADRRSPPAVSPYTHLRVAALLQMWFSAYRRDALLHGTSNLMFFTPKISIQDPRPMTVSIRRRQRGQRGIACSPKFSVCREGRFAEHHVFIQKSAYRPHDRRRFLT